MASGRNFFLKLLINHANFCVACSKELQRYLLRFNRKVQYIPSGIDISEFRRKSNHPELNEIIFIWVGVLWKKNCENLEIMLNLFYRLNMEYKDIRMEIVGDGPYFEKTRELLRRKYSAANIKLLYFKLRKRHQYANLGQYLKLKYKFNTLYFLCTCSQCILWSAG